MAMYCIITGMSEREEPKPFAVIRKDVPREEVAKYYLLAEFDRLYKAPEIRGETGIMLDYLEDRDLWRILQGMSLSYRMNGMFWIISDTRYTWSEEHWLASEAEFIEMNPAIDKVTKSPEINRNPLKFRDYLSEYFQAHPKSEDDPEELGQFRPTGRSIAYPKLFTTIRDGQLKLVDGGNRLMALLQNGSDYFTAFTGRRTNPDGKPMLGDSVFFTLKGAHQKASPEGKSAIEDTVRILLGQSRDGKDAIERYWPNFPNS
jgi:hypothetical protein